MSEKLPEIQYDLTQKSKLKEFYDSNKILIFSIILVIVILFGYLGFYLTNKENKKILLSENYLQAKIYLDAGNKEKGKDILKELIYVDDSTYSPLSLFLIINQNLITDPKELSTLFDHILKKNKFSKERKNLLIYKRSLLKSNFVSESDLLESLKPLLNDESAWRSHALLLLGDFFVSNKEYIKAIDFYQKILTLRNLHSDIYNHAKSQLEIISSK